MVVMVFLYLPMVGWANELSEGTIINDTNIDQLQNSTFEGHPISELIPPSLGKLVRDYKLQIPLKHSTPKPRLEAHDAATKKYSHLVRYDPETRSVSGYVAGTPFPEIDGDDPHAGDKELYNLFWNFGLFGPSATGEFPFLFIKADKGVERFQVWQETILNFSGRAVEPHTLPLGNSKNIQKRDALFAKEPFDIKGLGTFTQRYVDGSPDDVWVYIRAIRRTRRVSGGTWADAIGGSDVNLDDINGFNAHPTWFESARFVGQRWMLTWFIDGPQQNREADTLNEKFPYLRLSEWPHWNADQKWEPVLVNVIEIKPKEDHPFYSKKILYDLAELPGRPCLLEAYDKQGDLWKIETIATGYKRDEFGNMWLSGFNSFMHDIKFGHATLLVGDDFSVDYSLEPDDVTQNMLIVR